MYTALHSASTTLTGVIRQALEQSFPALFDAGAGGNRVVTTNTPEEMGTDTEGVSVWLYRVVRDEHRLNDAPRRDGPDHLHRHSLPVRLHYLITPIISTENLESHEAEHLILGRILQTFNDKARFRGSDLLADFTDTDVEITARLEPMSLEEVTRIWDALETPYQLSVSYEVSVVHIESAHGPAVIPPVDYGENLHAVITGGLSS